MSIMKLLKPIALSMCFMQLVAAQNEEVTIGIDTLSEHVYMLTGKGGNIGVFVGQDNVFMIDDQFAPLSDKIKKTISTLTDLPISILFNTHMHGDHTGGNANFNSKTTTVVAHDNVRKSLKERLLENNKLDNKMLPEISFSDDITFYDGDETIMAFHVHNAHTDGDAMVYFLNNNVLHMGDTYLSGRYPFIDLKNGGSVEGYINAQKKALLLINDETKIIPGHGRPSNKKELESYVNMLVFVKEKILSEIKMGKSFEEVSNNTKLLSAYDKTHGDGFINPKRMREVFYEGLKK